MTINQLARLAECSEPISEDSPGGAFLRYVEQGVRDAEERGWTDESSHEIADGAPDTNTWARWQEFVDLGAWEEDVNDLVGGSEDMTTLAGFALYMIAARLANALHEENDSE